MSNADHWLSRAIRLEKKEVPVEEWTLRFKLFMQKAEEGKAVQALMRVLNLFRQLGADCGGSSRLFKRKGNAAVYEMVSGVLRDWIRVSRSVKEQNSAGTWSSVFHDYMREGNTVGGTNANILHRKLTDEYIEIVKEALEGVKLEPIDSATLREFLHFLMRHREDPYSCLVGLHPSPAILERVQDIDASELYRNMKHHDGKTSKAICVELLDEIVHMYNLDNEQVRVKLNQLIGKLRRVHRTKPGAIVLLMSLRSRRDSDDDDDLGSVPDDDDDVIGLFHSSRRKALKSNAFACLDYRFARWQSVDQTYTCANVYLSPTETSTTAVPAELVLPISSEVYKEFLKVGEADVTKMERCVTLPENDAFQSIMQSCAKLLHEHVQAQGLDSQVILHAEHNACSLNDLSKLRHGKELLDEVQVKQPPDLYGRCKMVARSVLARNIHKLREQSEDSETFLPTIKQRIEQLERFDYRDALRGELQRLSGLVNSAIDTVRLFKDAFIRGERKEELVSWWLELIETEVFKFLGQFSYDLKAIKPNYTDEAPDSIDAVRSNGLILKRILKSFNKGSDAYELKKLIERMKSTIYPVIGQFTKDANIVLAEECGIPLAEFSLETASKLAKDESGGLDEKKRVWVSNMLKDIDYVCEMQKMEDPSYEGSFHIVPISGLVVSTLARMENECKTVLDLFAHTVGAPACSTPLHQAAMSKDLTGARKCILGGADVNAIDMEGNTAFHFACMHSVIDEARLKLCEMIFEEDGDATIPNIHHRAPIHYYIRMKVPEDIAKAYRGLLLEMLNKRPDLSKAVDREHNTLLHMAALSGNVTAMEVLRSAEIDVNAVNNVGDTALHNAVRGARKDCAKLLLDMGASKTKENDSGETPLKIALLLRETELAEMLGGGRRAAQLELKRDTRLPLSELTPPVESPVGRSLRAGGRISPTTSPRKSPRIGERPAQLTEEALPLPLSDFPASNAISSSAEKDASTPSFTMRRRRKKKSSVMKKSSKSSRDLSDSDGMLEASHAAPRSKSFTAESRGLEQLKASFAEEVPGSEPRKKQVAISGSEDWSSGESGSEEHASGDGALDDVARPRGRSLERKAEVIPGKPRAKRVLSSSG